MDEPTPRATGEGTEPFTGQLAAQAAVPEDAGRVEEARESVTDHPGEYLAYDDREDVAVVPLTREWTRVGRSLSADIRFDDPTVSRRHALLVRQADEVRVLDDRSLNGVFVNGERVEWSALRDGDEIAVGRHILHYIEVPVEEHGDPGRTGAGTGVAAG